MDISNCYSNFLTFFLNICTAFIYLVLIFIFPNMNYRVEELVAVRGMSSRYRLITQASFLIYHS